MYGYKQKYRQSIDANESEGKEPHERPNCMLKVIKTVS
jgi:hypothetical protein